jgi:hypothetical protein
MRILFLILLFCSCYKEPSGQLSNLLKFSVLDLATTSSLHLEGSGRDINFPPYLWKKIWQTEKSCLWYRTPSEDDHGILRLMDLKSCDDYTKTKLFQVEDIESLKITLNSKLKLIIGINGSSHQIEFSLLNLESVFKDDQSISRIDEKRELSSSAKLINESTLRIYPSRFSELESFPKRGSLELSYQHKADLFCHRFNEACEEVQAFDCNRCLGGWSEVVSYQCGANQVTKICGRDRCGEKGEPACPRGEFHMDIDEESWCYEGSRAGFCQDGLVTSCDENQVLICL